MISLDWSMLTVAVGATVIVLLLVWMAYLARQSRRRLANRGRPAAARAQTATPVLPAAVADATAMAPSNQFEPVAVVLSAEDVIDFIVEFAVTWLRITLGDDHPITAAAVRSAAPALKAYLKSKLPWLAEKIDQFWEIILQKVIEIIIRYH